MQLLDITPGSPADAVPGGEPGIPWVEGTGAGQTFADWNIYGAGITYGQYAIRVEGEIPASAFDSYLPLTASNKGWKCEGEEGGPGSFADGCQVLNDFEFGKSGPLPRWSVTDAALNTELAGVQTPHGRNESFGCWVTQETDSIFTIGQDLQREASFSAGSGYTYIFNLYANTGVTYYVSGYKYPPYGPDGYTRAWQDSPDGKIAAHPEALIEDGCDVADAFVVTPVPETTPTPTPALTPEPTKPKPARLPKTGV